MSEEPRPTGKRKIAESAPSAEAPSSPRASAKTPRSAPTQKSRIFQNSMPLSDLDICNHSDLRKLNWTVMAVPVCSPPGEFGEYLQAVNCHALQIVVFKYDSHVTNDKKEKVKNTLETMVPSQTKTLGFLVKRPQPIDTKEKQR